MKYTSKISESSESPLFQDQVDHKPVFLRNSGFDQTINQVQNSIHFSHCLRFNGATGSGVSRLFGSLVAECREEESSD
jgi:primosomal protein N'